MSASVPTTRKRPNAAGKHRGSISTASHYEGRYLEEVLNAAVFASENELGSCTAASSMTAVVDSVPLEFCSLDEYVSTFDPLVLEEAREGIRSGYLESTQAGLSANGIVTKVEEVGNRGGAAAAAAASRRRHVRVSISGGGNNSDLVRLDLKNAVAVFEFVPLKTQATAKDGAARKVRVAGLCVSSSVQAGVVLKVFKTCVAHRNADSPPCAAWLEMLRENPVGTTVTVTKATQLTSSEREFDALHSVKDIDAALMRYILKPSMLVSMKDVYQTNMRRALWPREASSEAFVKFLKKQYDRKQLEAIEMTACQLAVASASASASSSKASSSRHGRREAAAAALSTKLPFVLIQGPPGTGKTHTVCGVLNVWHLTAYQQYYDSLIRSVKELSEKSGSGLDSVATARWGSLSVSRKPRILVCTPSNAACDELMARVMRFGFCDGCGNRYSPNIVRIGGDAAVDGRVKDRFLGTLVKAYTSMTKEEWHHMHQAKQTLLVQMKQQVRQLEMSLAKAAHSESDMTQMAAALLAALQEMERIERQVDKLSAAWPSIMGSAATTPGKNSEARQSEEELKTLLLSEAEMVFSTLSSTQQKIFKDASKRAPFHTVLIDEAGQANEVAALQPMTAGAKSIVLVGDPQQLPATIKSDAAKAVEMERSLFERLQMKGCPVALLSVQYRMHPEIRRFPSKHFYKDKLEDAQSVSSLPPEPYHAVPGMGPYQVFDVAAGREERGKSSSLSNAEEARLAACLYMKLVRMSNGSANDAHGDRDTSGAKTGTASATATAAPSVAVITPYRQQRNVLRQTFRELCGEKSLDHVSLETIDSYQGRQVDVVILSCVRAGTGGGLGFVTDIRRMNVAITRARRSLWILGALGTLKKNKEWAALIADAEERGAVVAPTQARALLKDELSHADSVERQLFEAKQGNKGLDVPASGAQGAAGGGGAGGKKKAEAKGKKNKAQAAANASGKPMKKAKSTRTAAVADPRVAKAVRPMRKEKPKAYGVGGARSQKPMAKNAASAMPPEAPIVGLDVNLSAGAANLERMLETMNTVGVADTKEGQMMLEQMMAVFQSSQDEEADVARRGSDTGTSKGVQTLQKAVKLFDDGRDGPEEQDASDAFEPAKPPNEGRGRGGSLRKRQGSRQADRDPDGDGPGSLPATDNFAVSSRFPQLPEGR